MNTLTIRKGRCNKNWSAYCRPFLSIALCAFILTVTISTCYISVPVLADVTGWQYILTVWELITTLTVGAGAAPVSSAVNQAGMASELGQMTVAELASGEVSVAQCDAAIQALTSSTNTASQAAGGIAQSFASTAADAAQAAEAISAAGIDGVQAAEGAMTAGENLANCAAASVGAGSIVGMLGMEFTGAAAIGAGAVAVVAGVGLGILGYNIVSYFADCIRNNASIVQPTDSFSHYPANHNWKYTTYNINSGSSYNYYYGFEDGFLPVVYESNGSDKYYFVNITDSQKQWFGMSQTVKTGNYNQPELHYVGSGQYSLNVGSGQPDASNVGTWYRLSSNSTTRKQEINDLINGNTTVVNNPNNTDIVNPNGNYTYNPVTNNYNYNYENNPTYNTTNQTLQPIYNTDYDQFINNVNNNTVNNIDNSQTFKDFINNYLDDVTVPEPDLDPDIPEQPEKPTNPDITPEQEEQNKELMLPSNLKDYFPFCIPFDIYVLFTKFDDIEREAPHLQFELDLQKAGKYEIDIDFSDYDDLASLLRLLELIGFIMLLMVSARKIIGD